MRCETSGEGECRTFRAFEGRPIFAARDRLQISAFVPNAHVSNALIGSIVDAAWP